MQTALPPTIGECIRTLAEADCPVCRRAGRTLRTAYRAMLRGDRKSLSACIARLDQAERDIPEAAVESGMSRWVYLACEYAYGWRADL